MSSFEDIIALSAPAAESPEKVLAAKEVVVIKVKLDGMMTAILDEREDFTMDQDIWCARWQGLVVSLPPFITFFVTDTNDRTGFRQLLCVPRNSASTPGWRSRSLPRCTRRMQCSGDGKAQQRCRSRSRKSGFSWPPKRRSRRAE